jgi:hypothetical protein
MAFATVLVCVAGDLVNTSQDGHPRDDTGDSLLQCLQDQVSCLHDEKTGYSLVFSPEGRG